MELDLTGLVLPEGVQLLERSADGRSAQFSVAPLERGFGQTLGNSVRRILLSSLPGAAVWAFRLDGVVHEHQTVEGVVEDVHQIIQNLKSLVLTLDEGVPEATVELKVDEAGVVTAASFEGSGSVRIVNPEHHLFTLQEDRDLTMTLYVNRGRGWVPADQHVLPKGSPVDLVRIDAIYNPVLRANFTVDETRVGQRTDFDRLTMQVETNGSMEPDEALAYAAELARRHLEFLLKFGGAGTEAPPMPGATRLPAAMRELLERPIDELAEFSVRSVNSLKKENIVTLKDLVKRTEEQMLDIENFGAKSLEEIRQFLQDRDLRFGLELEEGEAGELYVVETSGNSDEAAEAAATEEE